MVEITALNVPKLDGIHSERTWWKLLTCSRAPSNSEKDDLDDLTDFVTYCIE